MPQETTQLKPGQFVWREVGTHDVAGVTKFYTKLLGWKAEAMEIRPGRPYTMFSNRGVPIAGAWQLREGQPSGTTPHWLSYVEVPDVDDAFERAHALGAYCLLRPTDIPGVGRHAILRDPTGATFAIYTPLGAPKPKKAKPRAKARAKAATRAAAQRSSRTKKPSARPKAARRGKARR